MCAERTQSERRVACLCTQCFENGRIRFFEGWHADPYIEAKFHGVWESLMSRFTIDKNYTIGGTGYLQNKNEIGHGYEDEGVVVKHDKKQKKLLAIFIAPNVHDFAWGADNDFIHDKVIGPNNVELHFFYKNKPNVVENWKKLQPKTVATRLFNKQFAENIPYKQYSLLFRCDGGMEDAMCTAITGEPVAKPNCVTAHELRHIWVSALYWQQRSKHEGLTKGLPLLLFDVRVQADHEKEIRKRASVCLYTEEELKKENLRQKEYEYGFYTDIESETFPIGLNEEIVRAISKKKEEPEWMTNWRLEAFRIWKE
ncbi:hypothetical protein FQR65_LT19638 [Abscondita terminalis]|nr:hypothetical protein FQR65_LT19638 [Abscondita terminalis]